MISFYEIIRIDPAGTAQLRYSHGPDRQIIIQKNVLTVRYVPVRVGTYVKCPCSVNTEIIIIIIINTVNLFE
jgi:hypothetical protein